MGASPPPLQPTKHWQRKPMFKEREIEMSRYQRSRKNRSKKISNATEKPSIETVLQLGSSSISKYVESLLDLFSRSNSILAGQPVLCAVSDKTEVACTDGETVWFNTAQLQKPFLGVERNGIDIKSALIALRCLRGVNLHELSHILYSPRKNSVAWNEVLLLDRNRNYAGVAKNISALKVFNLLEDQRIETLFSATYRNSVLYFQATITELILSDPNTPPHLIHLWVHGRRYIDKNIRSLARQVFQKHYDVTDAHLADWDKAIDDYKLATFPKNGRDITKHIEKFLFYWDLYIAPKGTAPISHGGDNMQGGHGERVEGSPSAKVQKDAQEKAKEELEAENSEAEEAEEEASEGQSNSGGASPPQSQEQNGNDNSSQDQDAPEMMPEPDDNYSPHPEDTGQSIRAQYEQRQQEQLKRNRILRDATGLFEALSDSIVQSSQQANVETMKSLTQVVKTAKARQLDSLFRDVEEPTSQVRIPKVYKTVSRNISDSVRRLRADKEAQWLKGTPTGRLNIDRVIQSEATDSDIDVFDSWQDSGDDAPNVEIVILLDQSSSMSTSVPTNMSNGLVSVMDEASASVWAIKSACYENDIPCTVVGYSGSNDTAILYRADDSVNPNTFGTFQHKTSTQPYYAISIASKILKESEATNKILVSVTDGDWGNCHSSGESILALGKKEKIDTIFVQLPSAYYRESAKCETYTPMFSEDAQKHSYYGHKVHLCVANPLELAKKIGKAIVVASR